MGRIIDLETKKTITNSSLIIYCQKKYESTFNAVSIGIEVASELKKVPYKNRTLKIESVLSETIKRHSSNTIFSDLDVLFNPCYEIDVVALLVELRKNNSFEIIWPGIIQDDNLVYSEPQYKDYKKYDINKYDILCVI